MVVPQGAHGSQGLVGAECLDSLRETFLERDSAAALDSSCVAGIRRRALATTLPPMARVDLSEGELACFAGHYLGEGESRGLEATIQAAAGKLRVELPGAGPMSLIPVGPARFQVTGMLGVYVAFEKAADRVTRVVVERDGAVEAALVPAPE